MTDGIRVVKNGAILEVTIDRPKAIKTKACDQVVISFN